MSIPFGRGLGGSVRIRRGWLPIRFVSVSVRFRFGFDPDSVLFRFASDSLRLRFRADSLPIRFGFDSVSIAFASVSTDRSAGQKFEALSADVLVRGAQATTRRWLLQRAGAEGAVQRKAPDSALFRRSRD